MSYAANQYNYATPLSSVQGLVDETVLALDGKFFCLSDNALDGTWYPISGNVGLWSTSVSDGAGVLTEPFVISVDEAREANTIRIVGNSNAYPVDFHIQFYLDGTLQHTETVVGNTEASRLVHLPKLVSCDSYTITVTKISASNAVAKVLNIYDPSYVRRSVPVQVHLVESAYSTGQTYVFGEDNVRISVVEGVPYTHVHYPVRVEETLRTRETANVINIHTVMRAPSRRVYGKVYITYTDPMLAAETAVEASSEAYNSDRIQVLDNSIEPATDLFTLYDNDLSGVYRPADEQSQVGWVSAELSDAEGRFAIAPSLTVQFSARPVVDMTLYFNTAKGCTVTDGTITFSHKDGHETTVVIENNTSDHFVIRRDDLVDVQAITVTVTRISKPYYPASILEIPVLSTILYTGYQDHSDLISIDVLEELTYDDTVEALGGVSANEVTVVLDNSTRDFYFNNPKSIVASQLHRNRKIVPWLGAEITPGVIEWYRMGTYWSHSWKVPVNGLTATVTGFDTLGLLDLTSFTEHQVMRNVSLGYLVDYVMSDAAKSFDFLEWSVEDALYDAVIPYAWFDEGSHTKALRKISQAYPMHIYCDRDGRICAVMQRLHIDEYFDVWSNSTNVINKEYSSLFTTVPNLVNVTVVLPREAEDEQLANDALVFDVAAVPSRTLKFNKPYLSDLRINIDKDASVSFTYSLYSWGIIFNFTGSGMVRSITCEGTAVDISNTAILTRRNEESIRLNGAVTRDISADFIQTSDHGTFLLDRFFELSNNDKFDVDVSYRGDIAVSIGDPILLVDGIAPDNRYVIRRHELSWNGALTGRADLNT